MGRGGLLAAITDALNGFAAAFTGLLKVAVSLLLSALAAVVLWQVISRYVIGQPSVVTADLVQILLPWFGLLGAAWTFGEKAQLSVELLSTILRGRSAALVCILIDLLIFIFAALVMVWGGGDYALERLNRGQLTEILGFPVGYIYMAVPVGGAFIAFYALTDVTGSLNGKDQKTRLPAGDA